MKNFIKKDYRFQNFLKPNNKIRKLSNFSKKKPIYSSSNLNNKGKFLLIFLVFYLNIFYFSYQKYQSLIQQKTNEYMAIANQIASHYQGFLNYSQLLLNSVNHDILKTKSFGSQAVDILSSIDRVRNQNQNANEIYYDAMLYWIDSNKYLIASSAGKVLKPIDLSSRDYLEKTQHNPWKLQVGTSVVGALSGQNILPVAVGLVGEKGYHLGTSVLSVKIEALIDLFEIENNLKGRFAIFNSEKKLILESKKKTFSENKKILNLIKKYNPEHKNSVLSPFNILKKNGNFIVASKLIDHPYIVFYGVKNRVIYRDLIIELMPFFISFILLSTLLFLNRRIFFSR
ncbi:MAG: cache domain-containing protein [Rickettsiales bacterium]